MSQFLPEVEMRGFYELAADAFSYPFRGRGLAMLVVGALTFWISGWFSFFPFFGLLLAILLIGYMCAFMFSIVSRSASGDPEPPIWPDVSDAYEDIVRPLLLVLGTVLFCMLPAIVLGLGHWISGWQTQIWLPVALVAGLLYLPMAMMGVCLTESFLMASPHIVIPAIFRVPVEYATVCAALAVVVVVQGLAADNVFDHLPIIGALLADFASLYCLMLQMRLLGIIYYTRQRRLGWFT